MKKKILYLVLMLLPLVVTLALLPVLPDQIPAHYGADGLVDRWGSKYETLIVPGINIFMGLFMLLMARITSRQESDGTNNEKICLLTGLICLVLFNALCYYFLYTAMMQAGNLNQTPIDMNRLLWSILALGLIILGNIMPKVKRNSLLGLRTTWSMKNDQIWKQCQRFSGIASMVSGGAILLVCLVTKGMLCMALSLLILTAMSTVCVLYSYQIAKEEGTP